MVSGCQPQLRHILAAIAGASAAFGGNGSAFHAVYAFFLGWPEKRLTIPALAKASPLITGEVSEVRLLGHNAKLDFSRTKDGLTIVVPEKKPCEHAVAFKITGLKAVRGATHP